MIEETLHHRGTTMVGRLLLAPGEATRWHRDLCNRVAVVLQGELLEIQFRDGGKSQQINVNPGLVDWDEPTDRIHRAVNIGSVPYEQITVFLLDHSDDVPQPDAV